MQTDVQDKLLFADDITECASTEEKRQKSDDQVSESCDKYDLTLFINRNGSSISASTWKAIQGAYHHREKTTVVDKI